MLFRKLLKQKLMWLIKLLRNKKIKCRSVKTLNHKVYKVRFIRSRFLKHNLKHQIIKIWICSENRKAFWRNVVLKIVQNCWADTSVEFCSSKECLKKLTLVPSALKNSESFNNLEFTRRFCEHIIYNFVSVCLAGSMNADLPFKF